jgi:DNA segregation ATPase FtsK/SpoIIIE, S-DNA-T family
MSFRRAWRVDLAAGVLLLLGVAVTLAIFSHDPADLPGPVYPAHPLPRNLLGLIGATVSRALIDALGVVVYVFVAFWFLLVAQLLYRRNWLINSVRLVGWLLLLPCLAVLVEHWCRPLPDSPVPGVGGSIGAWLTFALAERFRWPIGDLILCGCTALSVVLAVDVVWRRVLILLARFARFLSRVILVLLRSTRTTAGILGGHSAAVGHRVEGGVRSLGVGIRHIGSAMVRILRSVLWLIERRPAQRVLPLGMRSLSTQEPVFNIPVEVEATPVPVSGLPTEPIPIVINASPPLEETSPVPSDEPQLTASSPLYSERERFAGYELPPLTLLEEAVPFDYAAHEQRLRERASLLEKTFSDFGINVRVVGINTGPVVTMYEVTLETGLRVSKVTRMSEDVALNLSVPSVRMVAPIPGKNAVGIEVPNDQRAEVRLKEVMQASLPRIGRCRLPVVLGKDGEGRPLVQDLAEMPHLLIAGTTGTGKSVCLNSVILSILMTKRPDEVKLILIDPKNGVEMEQYGRVPHLMHPIVSDMKKTEAILSWAVDKMEERYDLLRRARVRNIASYNELGADEVLRRIAPDEEEKGLIPDKMPYIVLIIDEMADLMMQFKKEVEGHIIRLAQKSRAAGIHLVVATQKPTVDVITGLIKSNLPSRICFKVSNRSDSRVVLDAMGADKLLGKGDMLFLAPGTSNLIRAQGTYASDPEILRVVGFIETDRPCYELELMQLKTKEESEADEDEGSLMERLRSRDKLYEQAVEVVIREGRGSVSLLQRALSIGYGRASRLVDFMAKDGIVGGYNGSNAREVLYTPEQWSEMKQNAET